MLISNRSPTHGFSPNPSPYNQNHSPSHYQNQSYSTQPSFQNSPYRGGGNYRGAHYGGPERRLSGPGSNTAFGASGGRGRGTAPTQFSNLSWTPASGTRGGRPATEAPRPQPAVTASTESAAVDADDNPFRPSKDLRVEDEGPKEDNRAVSIKSSIVPSSQPKSGFSFSLKTKNPVPPASKAKLGLEEPEKPETSTKESLLDPKAKEALTRDSSSRYPPDSRSDRDRDHRERGYERDRGRERELDREHRERDRRYDDYYDRKPTYRDPRDRDAREAYYRDRERDYRDPRDRDIREPRENRDPRDMRPRDMRDLRDLRDPRNSRDIRDRREPYPPRRLDERRLDARSEIRTPTRSERRTPPVELPKTKIIKKRRMKPRPTLTPEHAASESVYYRKPGNESVVGAGTYGKVFKGVHVYTKDMVALKKIRMEGERDGVSKPKTPNDFFQMLTFYSFLSPPSERSSFFNH